MKDEILNILVCPQCNAAIKLIVKETDKEIKEGILYCNDCKTEFPVKNYIPRFVPPENYAQSFGFQWNKHAKTQIDKFSGINMSRDRFFKVTEWHENLEGQKILEAGCGAGRFAIQTGAEVFSFDYSNAVDANLENNGLQDKLHFCRQIFTTYHYKSLILIRFSVLACFSILLIRREHL